MQTNNSRQGTLGFLWAIYGVICAVKAAWIVFNGATLTLMWGALLNRVANPFFWMSLFHFAMLGAVALAIVTAIFSFLAAMALLQGARSGRTLSLVAGFLGLISGPLGIALGVYTLIVMLPQSGGRTRADFASAA
jgi:hypothetical protein